MAVGTSVDTITGGPSDAVPAITFCDAAVATITLSTGTVSQADIIEVAATSAAVQTSPNHFRPLTAIR